MYSHIDESGFDTGKVIVAITRECAVSINQEDFGSLEFDGVQVERIEPLYYATNSNLDRDVGAIIEISLRFKSKDAVISAINRLMENPCVVYAEPDFYLDMHVIPNDPYFRYLWGMESTGCPAAWSYATGNDSVVVGVIDSGVEFNHPDLRGNMWPFPGAAGLFSWDFYSGIGNPADRTGHGTHVAGTIGAVGNNLVGVTGVCWRVRLASLKIGDGLFDVAAAIKSIDFASRSSIAILNASWGMTHFSRALKYAIDHYGGLFVASAGNSNSNNDRFPVYPASYDSGNVISVAATDSRGRLASFSNYGAASVDIAAPGADILSTSINRGYSAMSGTSMSAPHVAGAAALLKSYIPGLSVRDMKDIILLSADERAQLRGRVSAAGSLNIGRMMNMAAGIRNIR